MADIEIRAFGWRFLALFTRMEKPETADQRPIMSNHAGSFNDAGYSPTHGDHHVRLGFTR